MSQLIESTIGFEVLTDHINSENAANIFLNSAKKMQEHSPVLKALFGGDNYGFNLPFKLPNVIEIHKQLIDRKIDHPKATEIVQNLSDFYTSNQIATKSNSK